MARTTRAAAAAAVQTVPVEIVKETKPKVGRKAKNAQRRKLYKKRQQARRIEAIKTAIRGADDPTTKKSLSKMRGQVFRPRTKDSQELQQLKALLVKQQEEIETLKEALKGANIPKLEPPASPAVEMAREEPDSSPVKIQQQLLIEVANASYDEEADLEPQSAGLEVEEVTEETGKLAEPEQMEGVQTTTVTASTRMGQVEHATLPTVETAEAANEEADEIKETIEKPSSSPEAQTGTGQVTPKLGGTPLKATTREVRDSSADSTAGTPRNVRRSPRKRAKRRSFAGHSYAV